jgi:hypothetical protein
MESTLITLWFIIPRTIVMPSSPGRFSILKVIVIDAKSRVEEMFR